VATKTDLADAAGFEWEVAWANIQAVRPAMEVLRVSAKTGAGLEEWVEFLAMRRAAGVV